MGKVLVAFILNTISQVTMKTIVSRTVQLSNILIIVNISFILKKMKV